MRYLTVILSLLVILAGCAKSNDKNVEKKPFDDLRTEMRIAITDPEREEKALLIIDELSEELQLLHHKKVERQAKSRKLNANYDTTRAEYDAFISERNVDMRLSQQRILEKRKALLAITTPEEWKQILDVRSDSFEAVIKALQPN